MEKFPSNPIKKINQIRKVASAAMHIASMDVAHAALKPEDHTANINKKPETEIAQIQQQNPSNVQNALDVQLKKTTDDYFGQEVNRTNKGDPQTFDTSPYKNFRPSANIEDRRNITPEMEQKIAEKAQIDGKLEYIRESMPILKAFAPQTLNISEPATSLAAQLGANEIEKASKQIKEENERKAAEIDVKTRLGIATPEEMDSRDLYNR
jgi:hypothetical protein